MAVSQTTNAFTAPATDPLEQSGFSPAEPTNSAKVDFEVVGFGDGYVATNTPLSALHHFADVPLFGAGGQPPKQVDDPTATTFMSIPVGQHGFYVGPYTAATTPAGIINIPDGYFVTATPPGLVTPKPFGFAYAGANFEKVGAAVGVWSVNKLGPVGFTVGARLHATASIERFLHDLDPTPKDRDVLEPGGVVEQTYAELAKNDQHATLRAMNIHNQQDYKALVEHYANTGGLSDVPVAISDLAWNDRHRARSAAAMNTQLASHLADRMAIVNDFDGSETAKAAANADLAAVQQQMDSIATILDNNSFSRARPEFANSMNMGPYLSNEEVSSYEDELQELTTKRKQIETRIANLPNEFTQGQISRQQVDDILAKQARLEEQAFVDVDTHLNTQKSKLKAATAELHTETDVDKMTALHSKIDRLQDSVKSLEAGKSQITSKPGWQPDISGEAYASTQALKATNEKMQDIEKTLEAMAKGLIGMPPNESEKRNLFELEKTLVGELTALGEDKKALQGWLETNAHRPAPRPAAVAQNEVPPILAARPAAVTPNDVPPIPAPRPLTTTPNDAAPLSVEHAVGPRKGFPFDRSLVEGAAAEKPTTFTDRTLNAISGFADRVVDLGKGALGFVRDIGSQIGTAAGWLGSQFSDNAKIDRPSITEKRDLGMFGTAAERRNGDYAGFQARQEQATNDFFGGVKDTWNSLTGTVSSFFGGSEENKFGNTNNNDSSSAGDRAERQARDGLDREGIDSSVRDDDSNTGPGGIL